ncbi:hypothetical protein FACS189499_08080 [Clostridia bacterium]|nr:hypothetical protein FACS189499_08080 [Clostridia bacterium]
MKKLSPILLTFLMVLTSCSYTNENDYIHSTSAKTEFSDSGYVSSDVTLSENLNLDAFETSSTSETVAEIEQSNLERRNKFEFLSIIPFADEIHIGVIGGCFMWNDIPYEFQHLIGEEALQLWEEKYPTYTLSIDDNWKVTSIEQNANIYTFILDFGLSEQQIKDLLLITNSVSKDDFIVRPNVYYSDEQIDALCSMNVEIITKAFANYGTIVKGEKYYSPIWFFYSSVEDYKSADITLDELMKVLFDFKQDKMRYLYGSVHPYAFDLIEQKVYAYVNGDVDVIELCGYYRDFSMPLAYDNFISNHMNSYNYFHNFGVEESQYSITKNGVAYSPHWVYYNKPQAYKEAGITPEELTAMLPKYRELGILSDEAMAALENKIRNYK